MRRILLFAAAAFVAATPTSVRGQVREISGTVTQKETGQPLQDATVGILGQLLGVRTNERGEYRLRIPNGDVTVLARAIGFKRVSVRVTSTQATANFSMEKDALQLEGVVVTGQATTVDRRNASTAIGTVSAEDLTKTPSKSLEGNIAGKIAGAVVFDNSGAPGGGMQIQIRGATSVLGQGDPLYVVDGIIVSNASVGSGLAAITRSTGTTSSSQDQVVNRLADINPNDIESIEVLKSAAASAIYGSRATNGVVVITTKKGKSGQTRWNLTQRMGSQSPAKTLGSRRFIDYNDVANADPKKNWTGGPVGDSAAKVACNPNCPWYDWQKQLYSQTDPSYESVLSASGGMNNTRFFASLNDRLNKGILINTGARRTSGRLNLDQTIGEKLTVSGGVDVTHNFIQDGLGNNDNTGASPMYVFAYSPAILDFKAVDATGHHVRNPFMGNLKTSNPFEVLPNIIANEDVWRQSANMRVGYSLLSTSKNSVQFSYLGGLDRFQQEGTVYSPNFLQFEPADGFLGTSEQVNASSFQFNQSGNLVWTFTPGSRWLTSAQTAIGATIENSKLVTYLLRGRGLLPTRQVVVGATDISVNNTVTEFRDQSYYINEQAILLDEKLSLAAGIRADRSSANGDRARYYAFPKYSASYRLVRPLTSAIDELKLRAAVGQSGNRPRYGDRDVLYGTNAALIGGQAALTSAQTVGNPAIKPEVMNETEFGIDASLWGQRIGLEVTHYDRVIKDLLLTFPLPPSSGLGQQIINGGRLSVHGIEAAITLVPIRTRDVEWTLRTTYGANKENVDNLPVPSFAAPNSFGASFGRNRLATGTSSTLIWGNIPFSCRNSTDPVTRQLVAGTGSDGKPCHLLPVGTTLAGSITVDSMIAESNPRHQTQFLNQVTYKNWSFSALLDWRNGGYTADMTNQTFDEGGNARDYTQASPDPARTLGQWRYQTWTSGDIRPYIQDGTFVKLREVNVTFAAPKSWANLARARDVRISFSGRNLATWSKYWSFDPEFNNFGNTNFNHFIDLSPYPSSKQFFFSIDLGY
ncbi:MAG TPA: SusC/RagA family TonB-linked outer membrane protein [Gemmatimonadaceae bacterium]|nr:SusC/RagA family TonB-linked outer membrane protein [Gemmatimonadaceae bacterium]